MKRTLVEAMAGLAVLVLLASFHHQIERLRSQADEVAELRTMVRDAVTRAPSEEADSASDGQQVLATLQTKVADLETRLAEASARSAEADHLRQELAATKREAMLFQSEISRDFDRTRELVDAYHREVRAVDESAKEGLYQTRTNLRDLARRIAPNPRLLDDELLAPSVQLNGDDTVGSGTLVFSGISPVSHEHESYVLTSYHVVRNILADTPSSRRLGIGVTIYETDGKVEERGDMVAHDERIDAALIQLRGHTHYDKVARALPRERLAQVRVWEPVWAVGCPLGNDPIPTHGEVSSMHNELGGSNYWMINAPTYFGNSGGGIYLADTRELCGVFSKIYTHGKGNPVVVPHMGLCTPIELVYDWLDGENMTFVLEAQAHLEANAREPSSDDEPTPTSPEADAAVLVEPAPPR